MAHSGFSADKPWSSFLKPYFYFLDAHLVCKCCQWLQIWQTLLVSLTRNSSIWYWLVYLHLILDHIKVKDQCTLISWELASWSNSTSCTFLTNVKRNGQHYNWDQLEGLVWDFDLHIYIWPWPILKVKVNSTHSSTANSSAVETMTSDR